MRKTLQITILLVLTSTLCTATVVDFYSDATIADGDIYDTVNIYDSLDVPPVQTTVDMIGGEVYSFFCNDTSQLIFTNGTASYVGGYDNCTIEIKGGTVDHSSLLGSSVMHWSGGIIESYISIHDEAKLHVYGKDFQYISGGGYGYGWLSGHWADDSDFTVLFRGLPEQFPPVSSVILHVIPEPCTLGLIGFGFLIMRRAVKTIRK